MHYRTCILCGDVKKVQDKRAAKKLYCNDCKYLSPDRSEKISNAKSGAGHHFFGKKFSDEHKSKISEGNAGKVMSLEARKRLSKSSTGKPGTRNGVKLSEETKRKIRVGGIETYKRKHSVYPSPTVNPAACELFDYLEKVLPLDGIYATKTGNEYHIVELGYWVDYYEPNKNIVIEYYERQHNRPKRREKDTSRQKEIEKYLGCKFIVVWEYDTPEEVIENVSGHIRGERGRFRERYGASMG